MPDVLDVDRSRRSALKALREGRVTVRSISYRDPDALKASAVWAKVRGFTDTHDITYMAATDHWTCTCGAGACGHVRAVQLCTGHAGWNSAVVDEPPVHAAPEPADVLELLSERGWTRAAFPGSCARCGRPYAAKDPIRAVPRADQQVGTVWAGSCCKEALDQ